MKSLASPVFNLKGQCHDIQWFFALFLREQKMAVARASVTDIDLKAWPSARPGSLATYAGCWHDSAVNQRQVEPELHSLFHLSTATGSTFVFRLRGPSKVISPSSRFKISRVDSYIGIDSLFGCLVLRAFWSLLRRSRRREHGWLGEGISSVVAAPFPVTLPMCVTVKANALNVERVRGTDVDVRANTGFVVAFAQYVTKTWRLKKRTCGELWGRPARRQRTFEGDAQGPCMSSVQLLSARRRTFEHCTSCCPSRDATMVVLTKKKKKKKKTPNAALPLHEKDLLRVGANVGMELRCSLKSAVWRRIEWVHQSANDKTTTWPPAAGSAWKSCFDQLGHDRSAVIIQRCAACPWLKFPRSFLVAAIIFPHTKWLKKITDYRDTPALKALEFGAFFAFFHLFRYLKVVQLFQNCAETFHFQQAFKQKKNRLQIALQVSKLASSPIVMP